MEKVELNAKILINDGYGKYESNICRQANSAGTKALVIVNEILISGITTYFKVLHNDVIVDCFMDFRLAVKAFNNLK